MKKIIIYVCVFMMSVTSFSQKVKISEKTTTLINEDFNSKKSVFPILTTIDNYFIIDGGDYLISRNNSETEYAILSSVKDLVNDFHLRTSIKIGPSNNKKSSVGVLLNK